MILLRAFFLSGLFCFVAEIILDNSKLTPGHLTSFFTVLGAFLSFIGIYPKLIDWAGVGATTQISNFGHLLYTATIEGFHESGILGLFSGVLMKSSAAIVSAIVFAFIFSMIFKPKN